jgi:hypothetical protein
MNWQEILTIAASIVVPIGSILAWGIKRIDYKFDKVDQRFDKIDQRIEKLSEDVRDMDRRLCRLEGAFSSKECCMIKDERKIDKAE